MSDSPSLRMKWNEIKQSHQEEDCFVPRNDDKKNLLIVFIKNIRLGKVKTRLAKSIGDENAFQVYKHLVEITEKVTEEINTEKRIYFSDVIIEEKWPKTAKFVQKGADLGQKMQNSVQKGLDDGFEKIILIGSDLPDISPQIIQQGFNALNKNSVVFGPATDGGYYLIGLTQPHHFIFEDKPWSKPNLLETTLSELQEKNIPYSLLEELNDIDTVEDLRKSSLNEVFHL
ncbi:MAG: TIGR04282 family arsenosugar biosynthesis glycosyltransferase [Vicingus serpentipes]|nr:TIGR04282 family arsenosugar biosynthesis glycosyltransferase [Vicingus serpentipes]